MGKARQTLQSRKVWATLVASLVAVGLFVAGEIDADMLVRAITVIAGVFTGSVALEDGLSALLSGLASRAQVRAENDRLEF